MISADERRMAEMLGLMGPDYESSDWHKAWLAVFAASFKEAKQA